MSTRGCFSALRALPPAKRSLPPRVVRLGRRRAEPSGGKRQPESRLESSCYNAGRDAGGSHLRVAVRPEARTTPGAGRICQHLRAAAVPPGKKKETDIIRKTTCATGGQL